jgi:methyltransferase (TIGR00027 family)
MEEGRPSNTALTAAAMRAYHYVSADEPRVVNDGLALQLAGMSSATDALAYVDAYAGKLAAFGERRAAEATVQDVMLCICARSRFVEDQLAAALERGVRQLVILGAGLDSTAYRRPDLTAGMRIFEIDYPATQVWKRERLASTDVPIPANLTFVPFDFERQTLAEALAAGGVQAAEMTFFTWLGVQPYLTDETVMSTLEVIARFPTGSELVLDLMTPTEHHHGEGMTEGIRQILEAAAKVGEPFKSTYTPAVFNDRLQRRGFGHVDSISCHDWFVRHGAQFQGRFSVNPGPCVLVAAQVG